MEFRILGSLDVVHGGNSISTGSPQQRAVLTILLLNANRVVSTDRLLEDVWPDDPTGKEQTLWVYISRLRSLLEPDREAHGSNSVLVTRDHGYSLAVDSDQIDALRFERLAAEGRGLLRDDPNAAEEVLSEALGLWRGPALADFVYNDFAQADALRLEELRIEATENRVDAVLRAGRHREVVGDLEQLLAEHPHREHFVGQLMVALYRSGRHADALRTFDKHRKRIGEELGIEPSPELRRIEEQVLLHDPKLLPASGSRAELVDAVNPFKGLHAFTEDDVDRFFGRARLVAELVRRIIGGASLLALVGASGSGKSSLLDAGLIPAVRKGAVDGSENWAIARMVPGSRPFRELEGALAHSVLDQPDGLTEVLSDREDGILRACLRLLRGTTERVLLVIDQFEELFTLGTPEDDRHRFIRNLEVVLEDPYDRVTLAIGLRADFYGRPLEYGRFAELLADGIVNVTPLALNELEAAAEEPAARAGTALESRLLVDLLSDVAGQPGGLPLFQYALTELFERRDGAILTHEAYRRMGGVSGAIARRAEDLFLALDDDERDAAKQVFLRLVTVTAHGSRGRRRVSGAEMATINADLIAVQAVFERFASHRLLTLNRDPTTGTPTVEVAHEALLDHWPRLRRWIDDGQKDVLTLSRLTTAMTEWEDSGRQADYLLVGQRLTDYEEWTKSSTLRLSSTEALFLEQSIMQRESGLEAEEQRVAREIRLDRTAKRRLVGLSTLGALVAVAALVGGLLVVTNSDNPVIALVHSAAGDLGATDMLIAGVGRAERDHELEVARIEPLVDPEDELRRLAEAGTDLVIVAKEFDLAMDRVAPEYPDTHWVAIDPVAVHIEEPNVSELHFDVADSAFVAGVAAALTSETGRLGFIGGYQTFRTEQSRNGFEQGAGWNDVSAEVTSIFLGPVANPLTDIERRDDLAYEAATKMYDNGIDIIFHDAGSAGKGVIRAANERSGPAVWAIGSDSNEYLTLPVADREVVLTSTIKRLDAAVEIAISSFINGELQRGETVLGLADTAVGLSRDGGHISDIDGRLKNLEGELEMGHLAVSPYALQSPGWQVAPDVDIQVTLTDATCIIDAITMDGAAATDQLTPDGRLPVTRPSVVEINLKNASSDIGGLAVRSIAPGTTLQDLNDELLRHPGPPPSLGLLHAITRAQLGGRTGTAVLVTDSPLAINCINDRSDNFPLIVSPI